MKFGYFLSLLYGVDLFVPYFSASPLNFRVKYTENSCMYWILCTRSYLLDPTPEKKIWREQRTNDI